MALLVKTNGEVLSINPAHGATFTLQELQGLVGGCIEMVRTLSGRTMFINEEGKFHNLPKNERATALFGAPDDVIVGDAVIVENHEVL